MLACRTTDLFVLTGVEEISTSKTAQMFNTLTAAACAKTGRNFAYWTLSQLILVFALNFGFRGAISVHTADGLYFCTVHLKNRHCATSCKVAGSIPDYVFGIFH
jgi:hypothetical protein